MKTKQTRDTRLIGCDCMESSEVKLSQTLFTHPFCRRMELDYGAEGKFHFLIVNLVSVSNICCLLEFLCCANAELF